MLVDSSGFDEAGRFRDMWRFYTTPSGEAPRTGTTVCGLCARCLHLIRSTGSRQCDKNKLAHGCYIRRRELVRLHVNAQRCRDASSRNAE